MLFSRRAIAVLTFQKALRYGAIFGPHTRYRAVSDFTTVACLPSLFKKIDDK